MGAKLSFKIQVWLETSMLKYRMGLRAQMWVLSRA